MENYTKKIELSKSDLITALDIAIKSETDKNKKYFIYSDTPIIKSWKEALNELRMNRNINIK